jgi:hypothetical protein
MNGSLEQSPSPAEEHFEEKERFEIREISSAEFLEILTSSKFLKALKIAGQETYKSGYETGFEVAILNEETINNNSIFIGEVKRGGTDRMGGEGFTSEIIVSLDNIQDYVERKINRGGGNLLEFHFHPLIDGPLIPSNIDLSCFMAGGYAPSFLGVGQIGKNMRIDILLIQRPQRIIYKENIEDFSQEAFRLWRQPDIEEALKKEGFENILITLEKTKRGYQLNETSRKKISTLSPIKINMFYS